MKENVFTVENAKVADLGYEIYTYFERGFLKDGEGIVFVNIIRTTINLKEREVTTLLRDANGKEYIRKGVFNLYPSTKDYEKRNFVRHSNRSTYELVKMASPRTLRDCPWNESDPATEESPAFGYVSVWVFEDGEPVEVPVVVNAVSYDEEGWHLVDGSLPEKYWESKKDAFGFNEYKVIDKDGEEFIEEGLQKRIMLTPEQWAIVNEIKELAKKAKDAGIKFIWDRDSCGTVKALNMQNVEDYGYEVEAFEGGQLFPFKNAIFADTEFGFYDYCGCDNMDRLAMKPTPREKKIWLKNQEQQ